MDEVRTGIGMYGELRSPPIFWPFLLFVQARACASAGLPEEGLGVDRSGDLDPGPDSGASILPEVQLLKGDLLLALATDEARGAAGRRAVVPAVPRSGDRARGADGPAPGVDPARAAAGGEPAIPPPRRLLSPILATFTEGFDTADLREARELLEACWAATRGVRIRDLVDEGRKR